jgi:hypothetical protein
MPQGSSQLLPSSSEPGLKPKGHEHEIPPPAAAPTALLSAQIDLGSQPSVGKPVLHGSHCIRVAFKPGLNLEFRTIELVIRFELKLQPVKFETMMNSFELPTNETPCAAEP